MINLTNAFKDAASLAEKWSFYDFVKSIKDVEPSLQDIRIDWRFSDLNSYSEIVNSFMKDWQVSNLSDRTWICLSIGRKRVAYIRSDMPLAFFLEEYRSANLERLAEQVKVITLFCTSFSRREYCIDLSSEREMLPLCNRERQFWNMPEEIVSPLGFSIEELWWATTLKPVTPESPNNITNKIIGAARKSDSEEWNRNILECFHKHLDNFTIEVETDTGSEWGRLFKSDTFIAFLRLDMPLVIALRDRSHIAQNFIGKHLDPTFQLIEVEDFEKSINTVDKGALEECLPQWKLHSLPKFFSILDFVDETEFIGYKT